MSHIITFIGGLTLGFIIGCLIAIVGNLQKQIVDAEHNGHRR